MKNEKTKTNKHRTPEETLKLEKGVVAAINREDALKNIGTSLDVSETYAYQIAKKLGYGQMLVSGPEREKIREMRGTTSRFGRSVRRTAA